jgi:hypothetical protein
MDMTTILKTSWWDNFNYDLYLQILKLKAKTI